MLEPIITINNLEKYYGDRKVLNGINLSLYPGQVLGYIGPNGAGKSTTVKILCGLITDYEGDVRIKGIDLRENPIGAKSQIGYIPELAELYDVLTPREFLRFCGQLYNMEAEKCDLRIAKMMDAFGLGNQLDQRMENFSKGMKQKVLIASGILHNPDVIIMDEPLSGLDANSVIIIKELIHKLAQEGKAIFYCSHMMDIVEKVSDRIILIHQGAIVADGSFAELQQKEGKESLEQIFSQLTSTNSGETAAGELMDAFK